METLDLHLKQQGDGQVLAFLTGRGLSTTFSVTPNKRLNQSYDAWLRRFIANHDSKGSLVPEDVLQNYKDRLTNELEIWLSSHEWSELKIALTTNPGIPIRLWIDTELSDLTRLPWESWTENRPLWRVQHNGTTGAIQTQSNRKPRLLLVVGNEDGLDLSSEVRRLEKLKNDKRIELKILRGQECSPSEIRKELEDPKGWDALIFLGHSESDPNNGGRLHLGDNSWLSAKAVDQQLKTAVGNGLRLILLNSCSGLDWSTRALEFGVSWAVCFREVVPSEHAANSFHQILVALEQGSDLIAAVDKTRKNLNQDGKSSTAFLLSTLSTSTAIPFKLPLRKRRQFLRRLRSSTKTQLITAATAAAIGAFNDVVPWNPINHGLLNQRLRLQRVYRDVTKQPGPTTKPLPVLILEKRRAYPALNLTHLILLNQTHRGATDAYPQQTFPGLQGIINPNQKRISRAAIKEVLERVPPKKVPLIGLDLVLDEPSIEPVATQQLASLITKQKRPKLFAGYFGEWSNAEGAGTLSKPVPILRKAGLESYNLAVNTDPGWFKDSQRNQAPLQIKAPITSDFFSSQLSQKPSTTIPTDAIIDWSIPWEDLIYRIDVNELNSLNSEILLIGTDGQFSLQHPDLFNPPSAAIRAIKSWQLPLGSIPGVMVQGVMAQSIHMGHWLMPASSAMTTLLSAGVGVLAAAGIQSRKIRVAAVGIISLIFIWACYQWTISGLILIPILLPIATFCTITLNRK